MLLSIFSTESGSEIYCAWQLSCASVVNWLSISCKSSSRMASILRKLYWFLEYFPIKGMAASPVMRLVRFLWLPILRRKGVRSLGCLCVRCNLLSA